MRICEICGNEFKKNRMKLTCSSNCSRLLKIKRIKELNIKKRKEYLAKIKILGYTEKEYKKKDTTKIRTVYDEGLSVDWSIKELAMIKLIKDRDYV